MILTNVKKQGYKIAITFSYYISYNITFISYHLSAASLCSADLINFSKVLIISLTKLMIMIII